MAMGKQVTKACLLQAAALLFSAFAAHAESPGSAHSAKRPLLVLKLSQRDEFREPVANGFQGSRANARWTELSFSAALGMSARTDKSIGKVLAAPTRVFVAFEIGEQPLRPFVGAAIRMRQKDGYSPLFREQDSGLWPRAGVAFTF